MIYVSLCKPQGFLEYNVFMFYHVVFLSIMNDVFSLEDICVAS
jgi:hypothetical protein